MIPRSPLCPQARTARPSPAGSRTWQATIHPMIAISDDDPVPHTAAFAAAAVSPPADRAGPDGATALALTALDAWRRPASPTSARNSP